MLLLIIESHPYDRFILGFWWLFHCCFMQWLPMQWHKAPDSKVHGANMGPTWVLSAWPHELYQGCHNMETLSTLLTGALPSQMLSNADHLRLLRFKPQQVFQQATMLAVIWDACKLTLFNCSNQSPLPLIKQKIAWKVHTSRRRKYSNTKGKLNKKYILYKWRAWYMWYIEARA